LLYKIYNRGKMSHEILAVVVEDNFAKSEATQMILGAVWVDDKDITRAKDWESAEKIILKALSQANQDLIIALDVNIPSWEESPNSEDDGNNSWANAVKLVDNVIDSAKQFTKTIVIILNSSAPENNRTFARYIDTEIEKNALSNIVHISVSQADFWAQLQAIIGELNSK